MPHEFEIGDTAIFIAGADEVPVIIVAKVAWSPAISATPSYRIAFCGEILDAWPAQLRPVQ